MANFTFGGLEITYDGSQEVLNALENAINRGLKVCGDKAVDYAKKLCPYDETSNGRHLRDNIAREVDGHECYIGVKTMKPPYGIYVEFGTGVEAEGGRGRKTPWVYRRKDGRFFTTSGMKAQPFIRPSARDHVDEYKKIIKDSLENA